MDKTMPLYHGSSFIIERPEFGKGNPFNDYGLGFYCTETLELAKEWSVPWGRTVLPIGILSGPTDSPF